MGVILSDIAVISIHALREEGDSDFRSGFQREHQFLSTPSARRATGHGGGVVALRMISIHALREEGDMRVPNVFVELAKFLSTPSARRATVMGQGSTTLAGYFYPRPPRGGRRAKCRKS